MRDEERGGADPRGPTAAVVCQADHSKRRGIAEMRCPVRPAGVCGRRGTNWRRPALTQRRESIEAKTAAALWHGSSCHTITPPDRPA